MTQGQLIPTFHAPLANQEQLLVSARELHQFLESQRDFSNWIKKRIEDYGFIENQDFVRFAKKVEANNATAIEYHLSLEMAKELSMVERNEKGRIARRYFISVEQTAVAHLQHRESLIHQLKDKLMTQHLRYRQVYRYLERGFTTLEISRCMMVSDRAVRKILAEMRELELLPEQEVFVLAHTGRIARSIPASSQLPLLGE